TAENQCGSGRGDFPGASKSPETESGKDRGAQVPNWYQGTSVEISGFVRWRFSVELQALFFDCTEKTSGDWRNSGAGFSWSDRNKGRWICKLGKLLGRVHIGINLRGADPRAAVLQYGEKKLQEILDPMLKAAETTGEEDDFGVFSAGCEGRRD
ncbi:hypothetical protein U1Q18_033412, partial [Sarracenia purpurea var. burkii]